MKQSRAVQQSLAALVLLIGCAVGVRLLNPSTPAERLATSDRSPLPPASPSGAFDVPPETPAANLTIRVSEELAEQARRPPTAPQDELAASRERDTLALVHKLTELLGKDPAQWRAVFDVLDADDPRVARQIVALIREAVHEETEADLIGRMRADERSQTRRLALDLLCGRSSTPSLSAIVEAVRRDGDAGVRYAALCELAMRKGHTSAETSAMIDEVILQRGQVDLSPEVRNAALRMMGQPVADDLPLASPNPARPRAFINPPTARKPADEPKPQGPLPSNPR